MKKHAIKRSIGALAAFGSLVVSLACHCHAQEAAVENKVADADRMTWWRDARFGLFIHWGIYSVPAKEAWLMNAEKIPVATYARHAEQFNPVKFNADEWVRMAKNAGMKYIVITAKHHDGFAMFKSEASPFNIVDATPFKRDPLKELAEACEKEGIQLGFYYSQAQDWHHPGGAVYGGPHDEAQKGDMTEYIRKIAQPQVKELLSNYGKVAIIWWDTPQDMNQERVDLMLEPLKLQPGIIQNNRMGNWYQGDFDTPEQNIPDAPPGRDWEACMTMNDSWGYNKQDLKWKSTKDLLIKLADITSKGGNFLLNVGPTAEGVIPDPSVERLAEIGKWMKVNGESIYGTTKSPLKPLSWGRCTQKDGMLYLHVFDWPKDGKLVVPGMYGAVKRAYLLADADKAQLKADVTQEGTVIAVGEKAPDENVSVVAVEFVEGRVITSPLVEPAADGTILLAPKTALIHGNAQVENHSGIDNIGWWADPGCFVTWNCKVTEPGEYAVEVTNSCMGAGGSDYTVSIGGESIPGVVEGTADWHTYNTKKIGVIAVPKAGIYEVAIKPLNNKSPAIMNLRSIRLTPVKATGAVDPDPAAKLARPTPEQIAWHECEIGMFICLDPATWQDVEYDTLKTPLNQINPEQLDTDQWVMAAKAMGAKYVVFVAKHTGGFCWWQTDTSDYGVKQIPWRDGKGDVMKDLVESCRKHGIKPGVYLSPHDEQFGATGGGGRCATPEAQARYDKIYREQLTELLSRYGEMFEVWFDGGVVTEVGDILKEHAPKAIVFQGPHANIRWVGNEEGIAPYPNWNAVPLDRAKSGVATWVDGHPEGDVWLPNECDARIRATWFWNSTGAHTLKSLDHLMMMYYQSVGRGAVLLLNMAPDTSGRMPEVDMRRAAEFGEEIKRRFARSLAETTGEGRSVELEFAGPTKVDHVITMEDIVHGERVREYVLEGRLGEEWKELCRGSSIGHKKIDAFKPVEVSRIRWRALQAAAEPRIRKLAAYHVGKVAMASDSAPDEAQRVWEWSAAQVGRDWTTVDIGLAGVVLDAGLYQLDFETTSGEPLEIQSMHYVFDHWVGAEYVQKGDRANRYLVTIPGLGKSPGVRIVARIREGAEAAKGVLMIRKKTSP